MRQRFARQLRIALWALTAAFIIGLPLAVGPGLLRGERQEEPAGARAGRDTMVRVDGEPVPRAEVDRVFEQMVRQMLPLYEQLGQSVGLERLWQFRMDAVEQAVARKLLAAKAEEEGLQVSGREVRQQAERQVDLQMEQWRSQRQGEELERFLAQVMADTEGTRPRERVSEREFRKWLIDRMMAHSDELGTDLLTEKLRAARVATVTATEQDLRASYDEATVRQILVSMRPSGGEQRTEEEALERAEELHRRLEQGADFAELAREESDDPGAEQNGGLLEWVRRGRMPTQWDEAVFSLQVGQLSDPVKLDWGYVIVKLEDIRREVPGDFEQRKEELLNQLLQRKRDEAWRAYRDELREGAEVEMVDPEMKAYEALRAGDGERALELLQGAAPEAREVGGLTAASVFYQMGTLLAARNEWEEAGDAYAEAHDALLSEEGLVLGSGRAQALLGLGRASENMGEVEDAAKWYQAAGEATGAPSIHQQLKMTFERLGKPELAQQQQEWLDNYEQEQRARQQALEQQEAARQAETGGGEPPAGGPSAER
jgi:parvulin-like peptidyl-prolyl isomerase